jgi:hypothetical protein
LERRTMGLGAPKVRNVSNGRQSAFDSIDKIEG